MNLYIHICYIENEDTYICVFLVLVHDIHLWLTNDIEIGAINSDDYASRGNTSWTISLQKTKYISAC